MKFTQTIPAGADKCTFIIERKKPTDTSDWEEYTKKLEGRALKRLKKEKK